MLLCTSCIDRFIRLIFPSERQIIPWHSLLLAILACRRSPAATTTRFLSSVLSDDPTRNKVHDNCKPSLTRTAPQIMHPLHSPAQALGTTAASRIPLTQPHFQCYFCHSSLAARRMMDISPCLPFYITVSSFSNRLQHLPQNMVDCAYRIFTNNYLPLPADSTKPGRYRGPRGAWVQTLINDRNKSLRLRRYCRSRSLQNTFWQEHAGGTRCERTNQGHKTPGAWLPPRYW